MSKHFIRIAAVWFCAGVLLGAYMGISHQHLDKQVHVHGLLLGWVSCALFGLLHRAWPAMQSLRAATAHFWLHNVGLVVLLAGLALAPRESGLAGPLLGIGTVALVAAAGLLAWCVWRSTADVEMQPEASPKASLKRLRAGM